MTTTTAVRTTADGTELPVAGRWELDPGHADVGFVGRHFGISKVRGRFSDVRGMLVMGQDPSTSEVVVEIDMASVGSGDRARDEHLRSEDLFDVERHPTATFRSTAVDVDGVSGTVTGDLTLKGVTRPVTLEVRYLGHAADPWGEDRAIFSASTTINREDWGVRWNMVLEAGGLLVSKEIVLEVEAEFVHRP